jgi:hypothetical protein
MNRELLYLDCVYYAICNGPLSRLRYEPGHGAAGAI